jgi:hypothetical protein
VKRALLVDIGSENWEVEEQRMGRGRREWMSVIG